MQPLTGGQYKKLRRKLGATPCEPKKSSPRQHKQPLRFHSSYTEETERKSKASYNPKNLGTMRQLITMMISIMMLVNVVVSINRQKHDTCDGVICPYGAKCTECEGHLHCDCSSICDPNDTEINYICGTDGKTYK
jgi:hypothetical protein